MLRCDRRADAAAWVRPHSRVVESVAADGDVVEGLLIFPERGRDEAELGSEGREQSSVKRRHCARSAHYRGRSVHKNVVAGVGIGVGAHVRHHSALAVLRVGRRGRRANLETLHRKDGRIASARSFAVGLAGIVVPHRLRGRSLHGSAAANHVRAGRGAIHIGRSRAAVARIVVARRSKDNHACGHGGFRDRSPSAGPQSRPSSASSDAPRDASTHRIRPLAAFWTAVPMSCDQ